MKCEFTCSDCAVLNCQKQDSQYPEFCPTKELTDKDLEDIKKLYDEEDNKKISRISAEIESDFYCKYTRVEEIVEFAKRMEFKKIGIATCVGLLDESRIFAAILKKKGFEAYTAACKIGAMKKTTVTDIAVEKTVKTGNIMCNPILQAKMLNNECTDLNVVIGLCVGHDSLFYKYSDALVTTLVTKDRVLAHNPVGALYQTGTYYKKLLE